MAIRLIFDDSDHQKKSLRLEQRLKRPQALLKRIHVYILGKTAQTFRRLRRGGRFRGVFWPPFEAQYERKTDGVVVPAWGGVHKVNFRRTKRGTIAKRQSPFVQGRLRPSGRRVTETSNLMRDTGRMAQAAGQTRLWRDRGRTLLMDTHNVDYAPEQQAMRPFLFFDIPTDLRWISRRMLDHVDLEKGLR